MAVTHTWNDLVDQLEHKTPNGNDSFRATCPLCGGGSFYATIGSKKIMLYCHSGCDYDDLVGAFGFRKEDLYIQNDFKKTKNWNYWKEQGQVDETLLFLKKEWAKQGDTFTDADRKEFAAAETRLKKYRR